jgi:hypothetical protein
MASLVRMRSRARCPELPRRGAAGARVSIDQARAIGLKAAAGDIADEELEAEEDGSGLRYTFNIKSGTKTFEIGVEAQSGGVLGMSSKAILTEYHGSARNVLATVIS